MAINKDILTYNIGDDGIAIITMDNKNEPTNLFSPDFISTFIEAAKELINNDKVKGVILHSAKSMFMAGADLKVLKKDLTDPEEFLNGALNMHKEFREIEKSDKPFVACINGHTLGGGLELALLFNHRISTKNPRIKIGFPEIKVGLFPGGGGTVKAPYLMGIQAALMALLQGGDHSPEKALKAGLIGEVVETADDLIPAAKAWIEANPKAIQPWDNKKHKIPGGGLMTPNGAQVLMGSIGTVRKLTHGNYPAAQNILSVVYEGLQMPIDRALEVEARYFTSTLGTKEARNMINVGFFGIGEARKGKAKPEGTGNYDIKKLGILGAGMMGAGIAYVSAKAGMDVVLKDVTQENAEKGKAYSQTLLNKRVSRGRMTQEVAEGILAKINATDDPNSVKGCDMVIEAVFENTDLKAKVTQQTEAVLEADKIYASNTSTIPITLLAKASERPENFIGIHFFSPVDKMPLVEIIVGEKTSDKAIGAAIDYVVAIKKIPIVVNDSRGFFTSRCFGTYTSEGLYLLDEGVPPAMIENVAKKAGMPVGPLAVSDEVSLTLGLHVMESDPRLNEIPSLKRNYKITKMLVEEHGRKGKKEGAGFYEYPENGKKFLWPKLKEIFKSDLDTMDAETVKRRLLHRQALESYRCLEEGVLRSPMDGNLGSILGWGFPIYAGGALSYIDYYGIQNFVDDCDRFAEKYGERWAIPDSLRKLAAEGGHVVFPYADSSKAKPALSMA